MSTAAELRRKTVKQLAAMAKRKGVPGWHEMRKEELVQALLRVARSERARAKRNGRGRAATSGGRKGSRESPNAVQRARKSAVKATNRSAASARPRGSPGGQARPSSAAGQAKKQSPDLKDLAQQAGQKENGYTKDRLVLMVRDPYWLHAYWELTRRSVERARVAMGPNWHAAKPILRLSEVSRDGTSSTVRHVIRDIEIHGGVNNWYVDVTDPPRSFQMDIGYLAPDGKFLCLARSNVVTTPQVGAVRALDGNWAPVAKDFDRIYALSGGYEEDSNEDLKELFEKRLHRPMGSPMMTRFGLGASTRSGSMQKELPFHVDAELVVYGATDPTAHVTLKGEPVQLESDGTFQVRFSLPDRRQVLPVVASSHDGVQQRTILLAVERNTKVMETVIREPDV